MIDERFAARVATWLRRTDRPSHQPRDNVAIAMGRIHRTRQRRRWLWFLPGPKPTAGADDEQGPGLPSAPTTKPRGLLPAPMEGTMTMFSATKLVGLAAIVALVGGALAIGGPLTVRQDEPPLAATAEERVEFIGVRGTMEVVWGEGEDGDCELGGLGGVMDCRGGVVSARYDWDDDRLDGVLIVRSNRFDISSTPWAVLSLTQYLENDGGAWVGDGYAYSNPWTQEFHLRTTLDGTGDYDGLTAILDVDESTDPSTLVTTLQGTGVIVGPGLPEPPEPATQELLYQHIDQ